MVQIDQSNVVDVLCAYENACLDFKQDYEDKKDPQKDPKFELAKDIAALSNNLGGTIVVGAIEDQKMRHVVRFNSVDETRLKRLLEGALRQCLPVPVVIDSVVTIDRESQRKITSREGGDDATLLAINVLPYLNGPIAVRVKDVVDAYKFPVRTADSTRFLRPEELAMTFNSHERRIQIQLSDILPAQLVKVWIPIFNLDGISQSRNCTIQSIEKEARVLELVSFHEPAQVCRVPLAFVRAVWHADGLYNLALQGTMIHSNDRSEQARWGEFNPKLS